MKKSKIHLRFFALVRRNLKFQLSLLLFAMAAGNLSVNAQQPSFDCTQARTTQEILICNDPDLAKLDAAMSDAYWRLRRNLDSEGAGALLRAQREFLANRDRQADKKALIKAYEEWLNALKYIETDRSVMHLFAVGPGADRDIVEHHTRACLRAMENSRPRPTPRQTPRARTPDGEAAALANARSLIGPNNKFKDPDIEAAYQRYVKRKKGQGVRDRAEWKVESDYWTKDSPMARGTRFNKTAGANYPYSEVHLANGKRVDSYRRGEPPEKGEIVSRKASDFDSIEEDTFRGYLSEMKTKYAPGTKINAPKYGDKLKGQTLQGRQILEVPKTNETAANRARFEKIARSEGIEIRYTPEYQTTVFNIASRTGYDFSNYPQFEEREAKFWRRCNELKQEMAKIKQVAQSPTATRKQKELAAKGAAELENVITATETMLKDSTLKSPPEKREEIFGRVQSLLSQANAVAISTESKVGIPHSSSVSDSLVVAKVKKGSGVGNAFFGLGAKVSVNATYVPTTPKVAEDNKNTYGSSGGGILLEGAAGGMGRISTVKYDGRYNALVMDDHLVYFMKAPSWEAAALCRDIARDKLMRVGVSMGKTSLVYGDKSTYENTGVARNLLLADQFLGDFVFGKHKWTKGYKFPNGYEPQTTNVTADMLVQFVFKGFQFVTKDNEIQIKNLAVNVRFMPVSKKPAPDGGMLPDMDALTRGYAPPPAFLANAQYLTSHFEFFRQERIVAKTIAYGELAALFRHYKQAGVNLESLASAMERG